jgi:hypothetical protein
MTRGSAGVAVALVVLAGAIYFSADFNSSSRPATTPGASAAAAGSDRAQLMQLTAQMGELQRSLLALQAQMAARDKAAAPRTGPAGDAKAPGSGVDPSEVAATRAADDERLRDYVAGITQAFNSEPIDAAWANQTSARVSAAFEANAALRNVSHKVECRRQTCRVQIDGVDPYELSKQVPAMMIGLVDVLPSMAVDPAESDNGRNAMVMYLSSQSTARAMPGK